MGIQRNKMYSITDNDGNKTLTVERDVAAGAYRYWIKQEGDGTLILIKDELGDLITVLTELFEED